MLIEMFRFQSIAVVTVKFQQYVSIKFIHFYYMSFTKPSTLSGNSLGNPPVMWSVPQKCRFALPVHLESHYKEI